MCLIAAAVGRPGGIRWYYGLLMPASALLLVAALLRPMALTIRRGGVRWREHVYPLAELRAHARRRDAWLREVWRSTR